MSPDPIVCPFCPLGCDDVRVSHSDGTVDVDCDLARHQFDSAVNHSPARIGSKTVDTLDFVAFRSRLALPDCPTIEFNGASIQEAKSIEALVKTGVIQVNLDVDAGSVALNQAIARDGVIAATLGDVCARSDLIWVIGDIDSRTPRLAERLGRSKAKLHQTSVLTVDSLSRLHRASGQRNEATGRPSDSAGSLIDLIRSSGYTSIVIGDSPFEKGSEVVASEMLLRLIARWNELPGSNDRGEDDLLRRAVILRIDHHQNLRSVMRWRNNQVSSAGLSVLPSPSVRIGPSCGDQTTNVRLQIGGPDPGEPSAFAYLPASSPGVHFAEVTIRGDGSISLPLSAIAAAPHASRFEVLRRMVEIS